MKVVFETDVIFFDYRGDDSLFLERVYLKHITSISCVPHIGMEVNIGRKDDEMATHKVESVIWVEEDDSLWVRLEEWETGIYDNEDEEEWDYFDSLVEDFVKKDKWEVIGVSTKRTKEKSKWK